MEKANVVIETDAELLEKLPWNKPSKVKEFLFGLAIVKEKYKELDPEAYKDMSEWGRNFDTAYNLTNDMNGVSKLQYLNLWMIRNSHGDVMSFAVFLPNDFQVLFARHFVFNKK